MVYCIKISLTNLELRLLYDTQGLPCSIYKVSTNMPTYSVTCGGANQLNAWHLRPCHWKVKGSNHGGNSAHGTLGHVMTAHVMGLNNQSQ